MLALFKFLYRALRFVALRLIPKSELTGRSFSNLMLKRYGDKFSGDIINVSGWDDRDGEGGYYRDYFPHHKRYVVTNASVADKGFGSLTDSKIEEFALDLEDEPPKEFDHAFDVVFNHTTLEHVLKFEASFAHLCSMSRDAVILVVPLLQQIHITKSYGDYWRPTTLTLHKLFRKNGFTPLVIGANDQPFSPIYGFVIAVRDPKKYSGSITPSLNYQAGAALFGSSLKEGAVEILLSEDAPKAS